MIELFDSCNDASRLPLELDEAIALCGGSLEAYLEVAQAFVEHAPRLEQSLSEIRGPAELTSAVHEVATCLQLVGATAAGRRARELETALRQGRECDMAVALAALRGDIEEAVEAVRRVRAGKGKDAGSDSCG